MLSTIILGCVTSFALISILSCLAALIEKISISGEKT